MLLDIPPRAGWDRVLITSVSEDSRRIEPGGLFIAVSGTSQDGMDFLPDALERGAVAVVCERPQELRVPCAVVSDARRALAVLAAGFYDEPTQEIHTIGVTGTNGKTTVCHWVSHLLGSNDVALVTTVTNAESGLRELTGLTTPSSPIVQRIAREVVESGKRSLVIEASSIGLEQLRLDAVAFDVAAFTNLTHDHLDLHGNLERYLDAKARLFRRLGPEGWAVVNADDSRAGDILKGTRGRVLRVGTHEPADLAATGVEPKGDGVRFRLAYADEVAEICLPVAGLHNVQNALLAVGIALVSGMTLAAIAGLLPSLPAVPGRQTRFRDDRGVTAIVDFAHNPEALRRMLEIVRTPYGRVAAVFGCPGGSDRAKRPQMGEISGRLADLTVLTSDNPKQEAPQTIAGEIAAGVRRVGGHFEVHLDRASAVRWAVEWANPGDVVLVAGKGHERVQIVGDALVPYSDAEVLAGLGFTAGRQPRGPNDSKERLKDTR